MRGIGSYIDGLLRALMTEQAAWSDLHLRPVIAAGGPDITAGTPLITSRAGWRQQDIGWLLAWIADRRAAGKAGLSLWHALDLQTPLSPLPDRRTVRTVYDLIPLHEPAAVTQIRRHRRLVYRQYLRGLRSCRLVLAISEVSAHDVRETLGVPREGIRVVYPALAPSRSFAPSNGGEQRDLLFVGVPDPTKQAELAIEALAECRRRGHDIRLRYVGHHRPSDTRRLTAAAVSAGVAGHVDFLGRVDHAEVERLYRESVLLGVSRIEGFGLPPAEAIMAGGRVVAGTAPVYREVLGISADFAASADGKGLADAYDAAISRAVTEPPRDMVERFSPRATAASLVAAYEAALG